MSKELEKTTGTDVSTNVAGVADELTNDDVQQGRLGVMQSNSTFVKEEKCRAGSIVNIFDPEVEIAHKAYKNEEEKPLEFMIMGMMKYWIVKDADTDQFVEKFPGVNANELPWEETVDGRNLQRTFHFSYVVLLPEEMEDGIEMPYELAFRSTAVKETKRLNSVIQRMASKGISSHSKLFQAKVTERANDRSTWWGLDLSVGRDATEKETQLCAKYFAEFNRVKEQFMSSQAEEPKSTDSDNAQSAQNASF